MRVVADLEALSRVAAEEFTRRARAAVTRQGHFRVALAGGTTPARLYALLAAHRQPWRRRIPWTKVHVFFSDERAVPLTHRDSNYRMAYSALLRRVPIPSSQVHPIRMAGLARGGGPPGRKGGGAADLPKARHAARIYESVLRRAFATPDRGTPRFDLVLLGMGPDGHVASIFPGDIALRAQRRLAIGVRPPGPDLPGGQSPRVTLTLPLINAAACVMVLVSGAAKAGALASVLGAKRTYGPPDLPAHRVRPVSGQLIWLVDRAAASAHRN